MALLPWIIKNPINGEVDSRKEKEIRILHCPYDDGGFNTGRIYPNVKSHLSYTGENVSYSEVGLKLKKVILGKGCNQKVKNKLIEICLNQCYEIEEK